MDLGSYCYVSVYHDHFTHVLFHYEGDSTVPFEKLKGKRKVLDNLVDSERDRHCSNRR